MPAQSDFDTFKYLADSCLWTGSAAVKASFVGTRAHLLVFAVANYDVVTGLVGRAPLLQHLFPSNLLQTTPLINYCFSCLMAVGYSDWRVVWQLHHLLL